MINYKKIYNVAFATSHYNNNLECDVYLIVLKFLEHYKIKNIIDIGSGRGLILNQIIQKYPHISITQFDISKYNKLDITTITGNICDQQDRQLITQNYDLLICLDVLEHLETIYINDIIKFFSKITNFCILTTADHKEYNHELKFDLHITKGNENFWLSNIKPYFNILNLHTTTESCTRVQVIGQSKERL